MAWVVKGHAQETQLGRQGMELPLEILPNVLSRNPHTATGFSPFELVHGYPIRGPLEAIKETWLHGELSFASTVVG